MVYLFYPRFRPLVASGAKRQTIRPVGRRRPPRPGELLSLRAWEGKPYRTRQYVLREAPCSRVDTVRIERGGKAVRQLWIEVSGVFLSPVRSEDFARADGFEDLGDMARYYEENSVLPFEGRVISWNVAAGIVRA